MTHELRTPLTTFRMYAEMLSEDMVPAEEDRLRIFANIASGGRPPVALGGQRVGVCKARTGVAPADGWWLKTYDACCTPSRRGWWIARPKRDLC